MRSMSKGKNICVDVIYIPCLREDSGQRIYNSAKIQLSELWQLSQAQDSSVGCC